MDRYFTIMVVPEREKGVRSLRIPRAIFHGAIFLIVIFLGLLAILAYDYVKILRQVYENKHLVIENRQLKEQIQLNQMKINTLADDLERINTFEKKLRVITGIESSENHSNQNPEDESDSRDKDKINPSDLGPEKIDLQRLEKESVPDEVPHEGMMQKLPSQISRSIASTVSAQEYNQATIPYTSRAFLEDFSNEEALQERPAYQKLVALYEQKMALSFGIAAGHNFTREWSELTKQSFLLAKKFARFDYQFNRIKNFVKTLEVSIHELDQYLLDKESFLRSTPTLLPTKGWITSYYGPRQSHYSNRIKMHEGLDIGAQNGTPILATADGVVTYSGKKPGFGLFVQVDHGYGIETVFAHAQTLVAKKGDIVKRGDVLARVGSTGYSTGPHVHYEVRINGTPVDPLYYILD